MKEDRIARGATFNNELLNVFVERTWVVKVNPHCAWRVLTRLAKLPFTMNAFRFSNIVTSFLCKQNALIGRIIAFDCMLTSSIIDHNASCESIFYITKEAIAC